MSLEKFKEFQNFLIEKLKEVEKKKVKFLTIVGSKTELYAKEKAPHKTGNLKRSISFKVIGDKVYIGTNIEYAPPHEFGATIKPVKAKYLTIPINKEIKKQTEKYGSPREYINHLEKQGFKIIVSQKGNNKFLIATKTIKGRKITKVLYILKKEVKIKKKKFLRDAKDKVIEELPKIIKEL